MARETWASFFLRLCDLVASRSKDESTKTGAAIVGGNNEVISIGYNGIPREVDDDVRARHVRPEKYLWFEHAERNAVFNAARVGTPCLGATIYVSWHPCADCARAIVQSGIAAVVLNSANREHARERWGESQTVAALMFQEARVPVRWASIEA